VVFAMHHPFVQPHFVSTAPVDASEVQPAMAARYPLATWLGVQTLAILVWLVQVSTVVVPAPACPFLWA